ncbi:MAG: hypothetical protein PHE88_10240 [Elusimicrobia bacterium]|nr:hypothetical protein [Elusimicrobiota bacterium]
MKKIMSLLLVIGMMVCISTLSHATANPDSFTLTVDVGGTNYSIDIASTTGNFSSVNLGAQASLYIGTASNDGNVIADWEVKGNNAVGDNTWTLANTAAANTYCLMIGTSASSGGAEPVWLPGAVGAYVSSVTTSQAAMTYTNGITVGQQVGLWARISMPTTSGGTATHTMTVSIYATAD